MKPILKTTLSLILLLNIHNMAVAKERIYLVPIGKIKKEITHNLKDQLFGIFPFVEGMEISCEQELPFKAYNPSRRQYHSSLVLEELSKKINKEGKILGIMDVDLYVEGLNFVFGPLAVSPGITGLAGERSLGFILFGLFDDWYSSRSIYK